MAHFAHRVSGSYIRLGRLEPFGRQLELGLPGRQNRREAARLRCRRPRRPNSGWRPNGGEAGVVARNPVGEITEMGHLRRLGGRWSALGGARRPRPAPAAAHRPCRSPGPHPAHSGPRTTAQAATRGQIRPPWAQIGWLQRACHGHVSVVCGQPTCPRGPGVPLGVPWGHVRWCGPLRPPGGRSRPPNGPLPVKRPAGVWSGS